VVKLNLYSKPETHPIEEIMKSYIRVKKWIYFFRL